MGSIGPSTEQPNDDPTTSRPLTPDSQATATETPESESSDEETETPENQTSDPRDSRTTTKEYPTAADQWDDSHPADLEMIHEDFASQGHEFFATFDPGTDAEGNSYIPGQQDEYFHYNGWCRLPREIDYMAFRRGPAYPGAAVGRTWQRGYHREEHEFYAVAPAHFRYLTMCTHAYNGIVEEIANQQRQSVGLVSRTVWIPNWEHQQGRQEERHVQPQGQYQNQWQSPQLQQCQQHQQRQEQQRREQYRCQQYKHHHSQQLIHHLQPPKQTPHPVPRHSQSPAPAAPQTQQQQQPAFVLRPLPQQAHLRFRRPPPPVSHPQPQPQPHAHPHPQPPHPHPPYLPQLHLSHPHPYPHPHPPAHLQASQLPQVLPELPPLGPWHGMTRLEKKRAKNRKKRQSQAARKRAQYANNQDSVQQGVAEEYEDEILEECGGEGGGDGGGDRDKDRDRDGNGAGAGCRATNQDMPQHPAPPPNSTPSPPPPPSQPHPTIPQYQSTLLKAKEALGLIRDGEDWGIGMISSPVLQAAHAEVRGMGFEGF